MYRPVILLGNGCRGNPALVDHLCSLGIPVLTTWMAMDLVPEDSPAFCGRPGVFGQRAANIIQQQATHLMCFGARMDGEQVAYDYDRFASKAIIFVYDADEAELEKFPDDGRWLTFHADLSNPDFRFSHICPVPSWLAWCKALYQRFRPELDGPVEPGEWVDTFAFMRELSKAAQPNDLLAIGSSSGAVNAFLQAFKIKAGQRVTVCATIGTMGADIPMAVGGCIASGRRTICVTGDGGFQLNAQELEVVHRLNLPITFFVFNNGGYNSIRVAQEARFDGRLVGCNAGSGFTTPGLMQLALAYRLCFGRVVSQVAVRDVVVRGIGPSVAVNDLDSLLKIGGPRIVEVMVDPNWQQFPRVMASTINGKLRTDNMEDMTPKLPADELAALMEWDGE